MTARDRHKIIINGFLESARKHPGRPALEIGDTSYTYSELLRHANAIAASIMEDANDDGPLVAVLADKSLAAYAGILGTLMASRGYVPLNPRFPAQRNAGILERTGVKAVVTGHESLEHLNLVMEGMPGKPRVIIPDQPGDIMPDQPGDIMLPEIITPPQTLPTCFSLREVPASPRGCRSPMKM